jgi:hypothetical protein
MNLPGVERKRPAMTAPSSLFQPVEVPVHDLVGFEVIWFGVQR